MSNHKVQGIEVHTVNGKTLKGENLTIHETMKFLPGKFRMHPEISIEKF